MIFSTVFKVLQKKEESSPQLTARNGYCITAIFKFGLEIAIRNSRSIIKTTALKHSLIRTNLQDSILLEE